MNGCLIVSLTKTAKKSKEHKENLLKEIQENAEKWQYIYVFEVGDMRNGPLKEVRRLWKEWVAQESLIRNWLTSYSARDEYSLEDAQLWRKVWVPPWRRSTDLDYINSQMYVLFDAIDPPICITDAGLATLESKRPSGSFLH
jgi:ribosomal protein L10